MEQDTKHISETIEHAVEGLLRFAARFIRTFWILLRYPHQAERLLEDDKTTLKFTRPYTFLAIGGFFFTLIFTAFPYGLTGLIDIIWFFDDIAKVLRDRWSEALTVSGLLLAGVPILFTVPVLSAIYGTMVLPVGYRPAFNKLAAFCFGYLTLMAFLLFYVFIFFSVVEQIYPVLDKNDETLLTVMYAVVFTLTVTAFTNPVIAIVSFLRRHLATKTWLKRLVYYVTVWAFVFFVFISITYTASIPGAAKAAFSDPLATAEITFNSDPDVWIIEQSDGSARVTIKTDFVVNNASNKSLITALSGINVFLRLEMDGKENQEYLTTTDSLFTSGNPVFSIVLSKDEVAEYSIKTERELDLEQVESLKQDNISENNHYRWFLVIKIWHDSHQIESAISLSDSYITWRK